MAGLELKVSDTLARVSAQAWDALVVGEPPFLRHAWLRGLEEHGCTGPRQGWVPNFVTAWRGGELVGAVPLYLKGDSYGEYVYDWGWAQLAQRLGMPYYPKLLSAIPFTPAGTTKLLTHPQLSEGERAEVRRALLGVCLEWGERTGASGLHFLFISPEELGFLERAGFMPRLSYQYHWRNDGYQSFDDFLGRFKAKRRIQIKRERRGVQEAGVSFEVCRGEALTPEVMRLAHRFYAGTVERFGPWGKQFFTEDFFVHLGQALPDHTQVLLAKDATGRPVAGTLTLRQGDRWYGRYWGCDEQIRFLHFEACYYYPLALAIQEKVQIYEPGAGGDHKYVRGFEPSITLSAHRLADPKLHAILARHLAQERDAVRAEVAALLAGSPIAPRFGMGGEGAEGEVDSTVEEE